MADTPQPDESTSAQSPQGNRLVCGDEEQVRRAVETAFDYRGDVTLELSDGTQQVGYVFDRQAGAGLADSCLRLMPEAGGEVLCVGYDQLRAIHFSGRDAAAGRSWETWVRKYREKHEGGDAL
ncbi:MAG: hypothetical protein OER86_05415 [Phycisphaerae bacterium]|nr:hypothetical protein [Phycisphaerae bacterium]